MQALVVQEGKKIESKNIIFQLIAVFAIYYMAIPLVFLDISTYIYQAIYFSANGIPKINRKEFMSLDRSRLSKLNFLQKLNCVYCEYANSILPWCNAVANQTEAYSCAIKHKYEAQGQNHQKDFYPYDKFL